MLDPALLSAGFIGVAVAAVVAVVAGCLGSYRVRSPIFTFDARWETSYVQRAEQLICESMI